MDLAKYYLALDRGLFLDMAKQTAAAVQGLSPKLNIWNTGSAGEVLLLTRSMTLCPQ